MAAGAALAVAVWILVVVSLPDFERYKPVPKLAAVIESLPARPDRVGIYRVPAPSMVFYLRRHVEQMFDERQLTEFFTRPGDAYCLMHDDDYAEVRAALGLPLRVAADAPRIDAQLRGLLRRAPLPRMLLVTNRPAP